MSKYASSDVLDGALCIVRDHASVMVALENQPIDFAQAMQESLAVQRITPIDFNIQDGDISGRKAVVAEQKGVAIIRDGVASHIALLDWQNSRLLYVTTCPTQKLVAGGTVSMASWSIEIGSPA